MAKRKKSKRERYKTGKFWKRIREVVITRAKGMCELCKNPNPPFDIDHCWTRGIDDLYFDLSNLTALCKSCHYKKSKHIDGVEKFVDKLVKEREGVFEWNRMELIAKAKAPMKEPWTDEMLENLISGYEKLYQEECVLGARRKKR